MTISLKKIMLCRVSRIVFGINANNVLHECLLFTNIKESCWTIQNVEWSSVLVYPIYVLQCKLTCYCWYNVHNRKTSKIVVFKVMRYIDLCCLFKLSFCLLFLKPIMVTLWVRSDWSGPDHDHWSKIIYMVYQRNQWICDQRGFISSFDAPWCTRDLGSLILSQITPKKCILYLYWTFC